MSGLTEKPRGAVTVRDGGRLLVRVRLPLPASAQPRLLLQPRPKKGRAAEAGRSLVLEPAGRNEWQTVLESDAVLEEGRWDAYVVTGPDEERVPLLPGLRDLRGLMPGEGAVRDAPLAVRIPYATKDGRLAIRAWRRAAHAEAGRITVGSGAMTVSARLYGAGLGEGAEVSLVRRGRGSAVARGALAVEGGRDFSFTVDYADLLADGAGGAPAVWDVFVQPRAGAPRVRVARLLDDVADRKTVFVYPATTLGGVSVRPYYTLDNDLSVEVTPRRS
ncbi:hypothetical protein NEH16_00685 [Streptomyces drozdowiczii]|uniref:Transferase n=1 Tax=Streptomyces drozdowiczii TaxID=202862 RepID=A0ABY6PKN2_9ACTN|nr:hypothetical protein [Streptomyces drozdowiczii]MCX0247818.1 hypothetical protein [Streptomyces drozdowiczii]UZK52823.1 hypothetical protein NEH16_00685 [Streptomyces drozdowiczii]